MLYLDSDPDDYVGLGQHLELRPPADGIMTISGSEVGVLVRFTGLTWWQLMFVPRAGTPLIPGVYEGAVGVGDNGSSWPALSVASDGRGCNSLTGRFEILELEFGPDYEVPRFAADFEQHCGGGEPALFGSMRINSTLPVPRRVQAPVIAKAFGASRVDPGGSTSLTFVVTNPNPAHELGSVAFIDTFPGGLAVAGPNGLAGSCGGGTIAASPGASSVSLVGATLAPAASCSFTVDISTVTTGAKSNNVTVTSYDGGVGNTATAELVVGSPPAITTAATGSFIVGVFGRFTVAASGVPTPRIEVTGQLPAGVSVVDNGDGTASLSGTPAPGSAGTYPLVARASNGLTPDAAQDLVVQVLDQVTPVPTLGSAALTLLALVLAACGAVALRR